VRLPDGTDRDVTPEPDGSILIPTLPTSGVYEVSWTGAIAQGDIRNPSNNRSLRVYAANMLNAKESDVPAADKLALASGEPVSTNAAEKKQTGGIRLWPYLLLLGLLVVMVEWYIYNRKVYV
jgi:hypothetical protein